MKTKAALLAAALACALSGCYTMKIYTGTPPATPSNVSNERWHHSIILGLAELSDPIDLEAACPQATWASIDEEVSFLNGLVTAASGIYTPRTYTVNCSGGGGGGGAMPPPDSTLPPPPPM